MELETFHLKPRDLREKNESSRPLISHTSNHLWSKNNQNNNNKEINEKNENNKNNKNNENKNEINKIIEFNDLRLNKRLITAIKSNILKKGRGYKNNIMKNHNKNDINDEINAFKCIPTNIQTLAIPIIIKENQKKLKLKLKLLNNNYENEQIDINDQIPYNSFWIKSETGSGKTLSYLLPLIHNLSLIKPNIKRSDGTYAIIISPTRELCKQIYDTCHHLCQNAYIHLVTGIVSGGEKKKSEKERLKKGIIILIATPGRLLDHLQSTSSFKWNQLRYIILDEADRLMDLGFGKQIEKIIGILMLGKHGQLNRQKLMESYNQNRRYNKNNKKEKNNNNNNNNNNNDNYIDNIELDEITDCNIIMASATSAITLTNLQSKIMPRFIMIDGNNDQIKYFDHNFQNNDNNDNNNNNKKERKIIDLDNNKLQIPEQLTQQYIQVTCKYRLATLTAFLRLYSHKKIVVFVSTCDSVDFHYFLYKNVYWPNIFEEHRKDFQKKNIKNNNNFNNNNINNINNINNNISKEIEKDHERSLNILKQQLNKLNKNNNIHDDIEDNDIENDHIEIENNNNENNDENNKNLIISNIFNSPIWRLHGNINQDERMKTYNEFSKSNYGILISTDVAARGLDLPNIDWIIQYDPPSETNEYVHRVGRTARRGFKGNSLLFILPSEKGFVDLLNSFHLSLSPLSLSSTLIRTADLLDADIDGKNLNVKQKKERKLIALDLKTRRKDDLIAYRIYYSLSQFIDNDKSLKDLAAISFRSFVRSYAAHSTNMKHIFNVKKLHLGHVAKSFGLNEPPSKINEQKKNKKNNYKRKKFHNTYLDNNNNHKRKGKNERNKKRKLNSSNNITEYDAY